MHVFTIQQKETAIAVCAVDHVRTNLRVEGKHSRVKIHNAVTAVTISAILIALTRVAKITIFAVIPVIRVLAVLIVRLKRMGNRAALEEFPGLCEERLVRVEFLLGRISFREPGVPMPDGIWAVWAKDRDDVFLCLITFTLVQIPHWPKRTEVLKSFDCCISWGGC